MRGDRLLTAAWIGGVIGLTLILLQELAFLMAHPLDAAEAFGTDYVILQRAASNWLVSGEFYPEWQKLGPYMADVASKTSIAPILYPPVALVLFVPFAVFPIAAPLWWLMPLLAIAWSIGQMRPNRWAWIFLLGSLVLPGSLKLVWNGNTVIWISAAMALATRYSWPAVFVLIKPSLAPLALFGATARSWWLALAVMVVISAGFGALWADWLTILTNARGVRPNLLYSLPELPLVLAPVIVWLGRTRKTGRQSAAGPIGWRSRHNPGHQPPASESFALPQEESVAWLRAVNTVPRRRSPWRDLKQLTQRRRR